MNIHHAYAIFCDDNDLPRIGVDSTQRAANYVAMAEAAIAEAHRLECDAATIVKMPAERFVDALLIAQQVERKRCSDIVNGIADTFEATAGKRLAKWRWRNGFVSGYVESRAVLVDAAIRAFRDARVLIATGATKRDAHHG